MAPDPPGATRPRPRPKEEKNERGRRLSTAPTHSSPSPAAGCSQTGTPLLPAARDHDDPGRDRAPDRGVERVAPGGADERDLAAEREVDHVGAVGARVVDAGATSSMLPPPSSPSTRIGISVAAGATLSTPTPLPRRRADDPEHVRPVAVAVLGRGVALDHVVARPDAAREVRVVGLHAGVDDRDDRARAGRDRARGVGLDQVEVPLLAAARVGRGGGSGRDQQARAGEDDGPIHG